MNRRKCHVDRYSDPQQLPQLFADHMLAIICEGSAEKVIAEKLLEAGRLPFGPDRVITDKLSPVPGPVLTVRSAKNFAKRYLGFDYGMPVTVIRILDSTDERFRLPAEYADIPVVSFTTRPEIERLVILREGKDHEWRRSHKKPSDFCKVDLHMPRIKEEDILRDYWDDVDALVDAIQQYSRREKRRKGELFLSDLLGVKK